MTRDFDARNEKKSRSVCTAMAESADTCKRVLSEKERRILEMWPRFEDGEPVWYGDEVDNMLSTVIAVEFFGGAITLSSDFDHLHLAIGERVKRHVPEAMDADGVPIKVGDTVWTLDGLEGVVTKVEDGAAHIAYESDYAQREEAADLTHTRPDSWERLEEDASKEPCFYFGFDDKLCSDGAGCPANKSGDCSKLKAADLIRRAKKLAGVE